MSTTTKSIVTFGLGFFSGWAARSVADSPQGVGVRLLEIAMNAKERVMRWAASERERLEDMMAEARTKLADEIANPRGPSSVGDGQRAPNSA